MSEIRKKSGDNRLIILGITLAIIGVAAWIYQLSKGMQVTSLSDGNTWGLYIASFFVAVGGGAGLLALSGISEFTDKIDAGIRKKTLIAAAVCFVVGGMLIVMDLGNPLKVFYLMISFKFGSYMVWDFWLLAIGVILAVTNSLVAKEDAPNKLLGAISVAIALLIVIAEGLLLSTITGNSLWVSGITILAFMVGALVVAVSLALLWDEKAYSILKVVLLLNLAIVAAEVLTGLVVSSAEVGFIVSGPYAIWFYLQLIVGIAIPLALIVRKIMPKLIAILAIFGVLAEKLWFLGAGQTKQFMAENIFYFPNALEFIIVLGAIGVGLVLMSLSSRIVTLPITNTKNVSA